MSKAFLLIAAAAVSAAALCASPALADDPSPRRGPAPPHGYPPPGYAPPPYGYPPPGYPPPGYAPYGYPPPGYGYPPAGNPPSSGPPAGPLQRRNPTLMGVGIALTAIGGASTFIGNVIYLAESPLLCNHDCTRGVQAGTIALYVVGGLTLGLGIPLLVYGAKKVPVVTPIGIAGNRWIGAPGGAGWMWRF